MIHSRETGHDMPGTPPYRSLCGGHIPVPCIVPCECVFVELPSLSLTSIRQVFALKANTFSSNADPPTSALRLPLPLRHRRIHRRGLGAFAAFVAAGNGNDDLAAGGDIINGGVAVLHDEVLQHRIASGILPDDQAIVKGATRKVRYLKALPRFDGSTGLPEKMPEVVGQASRLPENTLEDFEQVPTLRENMSEALGRSSRLPANTSERFGTITVQSGNTPEVVGNISGLREKMPDNSDHPPLFHSGAPENFAGISGLRFNGVERESGAWLRVEGGISWGIRSQKCRPACSREPSEWLHRLVRPAVCGAARI
jgi:hypothetical protein